MREITEIELKFNRKDFEEVYFNGNQGSYLNGETTKKRFWNMLISGIISCLFLLKCIVNSGIQIGAIISGILFLYFLIDYLIKALVIWKRNNKVKRYLNGVEKIKSHKLIFIKDTFQIKQDSQVLTELWTDFTKSEINEMFISLVSKTENYLIPKKTMTELEYVALTSIIIEKTANEYFRLKKNLSHLLNEQPLF